MRGSSVVVEGEQHDHHMIFKPEPSAVYSQFQLQLCSMKIALTIHADHR